MADKTYNSLNEQIYDYHNSKSNTFEAFDDTKYNPKGINEDKNYLNTDAVVVLNFKMSGKTGAATYSVADFHVSQLESQFKTGKKKIDFIKNLVSKYPEYELNLLNLQDMVNAGNVRLDRDAHAQTMSVHDATETVKRIVEPLADYFRANVQANHEDWVQDLVGSNPVLWYDLPKVLYSRGSILLNFEYANHEYRALVTHKYNKAAVNMAVMLGADALYAAHTHKPRVLMNKYEHYNTKTNQMERKTLSINVAASKVPTAKYSAEENMPPSNTIGFIHEQYESKEKINSNFINEDGLFAKFNSLKPAQLKRVENFKKGFDAYVKSEITRIGMIKGANAEAEIKKLKYELFEQYSELVKQYEAQLTREKMAPKKPRRKKPTPKVVEKTENEEAKVEEPAKELK